ncbi:MAG: hypothetical protein Q8P26_00015 [Candidatus Levybacteria bacterium]|nr:hypothetical protein [Candidatus Levybacteria bacterium]
MGERLSYGVRKHNRREKALARKQGRRPNLIEFTLAGVKRKTESLHPQQGLNHSAIDINYHTEIFPRKAIEKPVKKQRKEPTDMTFVTAGARLATGAMQRVMLNSKESHEDLTDQEAVNVLENLEDGIRSGRILSQREIAKQALRLGAKMGILGSVTTEIDVAAWRVLDAIQENKKRLIQ